MNLTLPYPGTCPISETRHGRASPMPPKLDAIVNQIRWCAANPNPSPSPSPNPNPNQNPNRNPNPKAPTLARCREAFGSGCHALLHTWSTLDKALTLALTN